MLARHADSTSDAWYVVITRDGDSDVILGVQDLLLFTAEYQAPAASWVAFALVTGSAYYHLWFVALLIQLYLLFPVVRVLLRIAGRRTGALLLAALLVTDHP